MVYMKLIILYFYIFKNHLKQLLLPSHCNQLIPRQASHKQTTAKGIYLISTQIVTKLS